MQQSNRKKELEIKKARLAALREERMQREALRNQGAPLPTIPKVSSLKSIDTERILGDLGIDKDGKLISSLNKSLLTTSNSTPSVDCIPPSKRPLKLTISGFKECSFEPLVGEYYSKECQTANFNEIKCETPSIATDTYPETPSIATGPNYRAVQSLEWDDDILTAGGDDDPETEHELAQLPNSLELEKHVRILELSGAKELTEEDKENILSTQEFQEFFFRASSLIEDALEENERDLFFDYSGADKEDDVSKAMKLLTEERVFFDETFTSKRTVTALDWSVNHPEIILSAYSEMIREEIALTPVDLYSAANKADGVCILWNLKSKKPESVPESIFTCQSAITAAIFSNFNPYLIIGGTYVGQIVIWDTRVNRQTPVQRTGMAGNSGHWEPIRSVAVTGQASMNNLVSVSADGRLCAWSLDMLAEPFQTMDLAYKQAKSITPSSVAFVRDYDDSFLIGAQDGYIYSGARTGNEPGVNVQYEGHHTAPVTSISVPKAANALIESEIYLTTSMDCSAKLWSPSEVTPLISFEERSDYILNSDWSPTHPALFATVDLGGHLDIWNLNMNTEVPTTSIKLSNDASPNCCKFETKGSHILVGDDTGKTYVFAINDKISASRADEFGLFEEQLNQLMEAAVRERNTNLLLRDIAFSDV